MSLSTIDQSTGNATVISGNVNDKVGNLSALTTTDKSSAVGAINEVNSGLASKSGYFGNPLSVTEGVLQCGADDEETYTIPSDGWYRIVMVNNNNTATEFRVNNIAFHYLGTSGRYESVMPFKAGAVLKAATIGNGSVTVNKYNF